MPLTTFPLTMGPTFPVAPDREARTLEAEYGDGYSECSGDGINNIKDVWNLRWDALTPAQAEQADTFLLARGGVEAFFWTPPGEAQQKFTCKKWKPPKTTANTATLTAVFERVHDPGS